MLFRSLQSADRQARYREHLRHGVTDGVTRPVTHAFVPDMDTDTGSSSEKNEVENRARRLLEELYPAWYFKHRGARLPIMQGWKQLRDAVTLCQTWPDERLAQLAAVFLTTDEPWIASSGREFHVFAAKASLCDDRLTQAERGRTT